MPRGWRRHPPETASDSWCTNLDTIFVQQCIGTRFFNNVYTVQSSHKLVIIIGFLVYTQYLSLSLFLNEC